MAKKKKGPNAKILLALSKMTVPQKVSLCRSVAKAGAANAGTFSSPPVPPAAVDAAATKLEQAEAAATQARQTSLLATSQRDDAGIALDGLLVQWASYVEIVAKGDATIIGMSSFPVRGAPVRVTAPPSAPDPFLAAAGTKTGEAEMRLGKIAGARGFIVERNANPNDPAGWVHVVSTATSKRKIKLTGLPSGRWWFRVAALGTAGQGPWTDPATCIVQ